MSPTLELSEEVSVDLYLVHANHKFTIIRGFWILLAGRLLSMLPVSKRLQIFMQFFLYSGAGHDGG